MGLTAFLDSEEDIRVIGHAIDGRDAIEKAMALQPDVILMDLLMPTCSGIDATTSLKAQACRSRVVMLTSSMDDAFVVQALRAGACSYVLKTSPATHVVQAIRAATRGESVLDAEIQQKIVGQLQETTLRKPESELTVRERDVLQGIAAGRNNQEIADSLGIGIKTVKTHVSNIFIKLGVFDRTQAAIYAIRNHLD